MPSPISNMMFFTFFVGVIALLLLVSKLTNSFCDLQEIKKFEINKNEIKKAIMYFFSG